MTEKEKRERADWTLKFMQDGINDKLTDEERTELAKNPQLTSYDSVKVSIEPIYGKVNGKDITILIINGDFREVEDLSCQMVIISRFLTESAEEYKAKFEVKGLVMPVFAWDNFWNNKENVLDNDLLRRTALSMLFIISGALSNIQQ